MAKLLTCHDGGIKTGCYTLIWGLNIQTVVAI